MSVTLRSLKLISREVTSSECYLNNFIIVPALNRFLSNSSTSPAEIIGRFDYLNQFSPSSLRKPCSRLNLHESRRVTVALSKAMKTFDVYDLCRTSQISDPTPLARVMMMLESREAAIAFFKLVFREDSNASVMSCCTTAQIIASENLVHWAQDMVAWIIANIGSERSKHLVDFMWQNHHPYESGFSVLDTIMRGFLKSGMGYEALSIERRIREVGAIPSVSAIALLATWLIKAGDHNAVWRLLRSMIRGRPFPSTHTFNTLIVGFCRKGFIEIGKSLLHVMRRYNCEPDVRSYNLLINAHCTAGQTNEALMLMHRMIQDGCKPTNVTAGTIMNRLCQEGNVSEASKVLDDFEEAGYALNVEAYNTLLNGYIKSLDVSKAKLLYEEMKRKSISPDSTTLNILVAGHFRHGNEEDGENLIKEFVTSRHISEAKIYDVLISSLCWEGKLERAYEVLLNMLEKGVPLSVVSFNSIIAAFSKEGQHEKAFETYRVLKSYGLFPSYSTCSFLLTGLVTKGWLYEAKELLHQMNRRNPRSTQSVE